MLAAYQRMKLYDVSQLPVLEDGKIVGIVDEEDMLLEVYDDPDAFPRAGDRGDGQPTSSPWRPTRRSRS